MEFIDYRSMNRDSFVIEISSEQPSNKVRAINKIVNVAVYMPEYFQDINMGLIYIYEYDLVDFKPFILTFKEKCLPEYIEIAGEQAKTKVYE